MANVLVIGNGYDIAHGLNTKYENFVDWISKLNKKYWLETVEEDEVLYKKIGDNGFVKMFLDYTGQVSGWVDLERLIKIIIENFEDFFENYDDYVDYSNGISVEMLRGDLMEFNKIRMMNCLEKFPLFDERHHQGTVKYYRISEMYYTKSYGLNKKEIVKLLRNQLDEVIELLRIYLTIHCAESDKYLKPIKQLSDIKPEYVISFNYTDTYKLYGISPKDVFHVHGSLDLANMVFGYNDEDNSSKLEFVYFKKYFQRIQKLTGYVDENKIVKFEAGYPTETIIHFYGHSMDNTDGDVIRLLKTMANRFIVYKYNQEDYEQKVINLIEVFGKKEATDLIQTGFVQFIGCEQ